MLDELEEDCWFDPKWLKENQLSIHNITEYFKLSPFYETNNLFEENVVIQVESNDGPNFILSKSIKDENDRVSVIGLYRVFDFKIFKGVNLKQFVQNQLNTIQANIEEIQIEVRKKSCWSDLKRKWELESEVKEEKTITLKEDFY